MLSTSASSPINNRPTITGMPSPPITMMVSSIDSNTGNPDPGILISSTDFTTQYNIPLSSATAQSTEVRCCLSCYLVPCFDVF